MKGELRLLYVYGYYISKCKCFQVMDGFWRKLSSSQRQIPQQKTWFSDVTGAKKIPKTVVFHDAIIAILKSRRFHQYWMQIVTCCQGRLSLSTDGDKCAMVNFFVGGSIKSLIISFNVQCEFCAQI